MGLNDIEINEEEIVRIDTTLPLKIREYIQDKGYKVNELIRLGIIAKEGNPQLIERIIRLEAKFGVIDMKLDTIGELIQRDNKKKGL